MVRAGGREACGIRLHRLMRRSRDALHQTVLAHKELVCEYLYAHEWLTADEGVAAELLLRRIDGLHDVALFVPDQLIVDGDGRVEIHRQLGGDSDEVRMLCRSDKILFAQAQLHALISMTTSRSLRPSTQPRTFSSA